MSIEERAARQMETLRVMLTDAQCRVAAVASPRDKEASLPLGDWITTSPEDLNSWTNWDSWTSWTSWDSWDSWTSWIP